MTPSKKRAIYWETHYNKEFSSGLFLTSEHQTVGNYLWSYFRSMSKDRIQMISVAGHDSVSVHIDVKWEQHHWVSSVKH